MEKLYSSIIGSPVFDDHSTRPFTTVKGVVLDPERNGKVLAFVVNVNKNKIISPVDVISWGDVIKVHARDAVTDGDDVLRVAEVQKDGRYFFGNRVEAEGEGYIGKVVDMAIDSKTLDLRKIFVAKSVLGMIRYENRIIPAKNILEVLCDKIIVKNGMKTVKEESEISVKDMAMS